MQRYSENQIRAFYSEFRGHKKYVDKLTMFDHLFGIIPVSFPEFDSRLRFFFEKEKTDELAEIYKNERNNPGMTERKFMFGETFVFNIKPANSNNAAYSNYILSSFLSRQPVFEEWIRRNKSDEHPIEFLLDEANGIVNKIEFFLHSEYDKSFRLQCMSIFYKGFYDEFSNRVNLPDKKRKFIELYLYAQGIIYSNYISTLKLMMQNQETSSDLPVTDSLDLQGKLDLMNELGIIDFLRTRYSVSDDSSFENKMAEILCRLTGEFLRQKDSVVKILSSMKKQSQGRYAKTQLYGLQRKTWDPC